MVNDSYILLYEIYQKCPDKKKLLKIWLIIQTLSRLGWWQKPDHLGNLEIWGRRNSLGPPCAIVQAEE